MSGNKSRRDFLALGLKAGVILPFATTGLYACISKKEGELIADQRKNKKLKILILGGTSFLGPHLVKFATDRGHSITTFTRGKTEPTIYKELFNNVEQLIGDRENDLSALKNRKWDAVIDNSGRQVEWTKSTARLLKDNCDTYVYTSSVSVFYPYVDSNFDEKSNIMLAVPQGTGPEEKPVYDYGVMKANSELAAINEFGEDRTIIIRPTFIVGPADNTNRFVYWPVRLQKGGEILVPGKKDDMVQYIDVRDLASWMMALIEKKSSGTYNAVGPNNPQGVYEFVEEASTAFEVDSTFIKLDDYTFLEDNNVQFIAPWAMPTGKFAGIAKINNNKALENGLKLRPVNETIRDTFNWWQSDAVTQERRDELLNGPNSLFLREEAIIEKWKMR